MSAPVFIADPTVLQGSDRILLDGDEGRHAAVVRRIAVGEVVELTDGRGHVAHCVVVAADRNGITCAVEARSTVPQPQPRLVVAQAIPKGDRGETAVETMTEVGVDEIVPWDAARCIVRWKGERGEKALRRWRATGREAGKQSRRAWLPEVAELSSANDLVARLGAATVGIVLHEEARIPLSTVALPEQGEVVLVIGPEGGLAPDEISAFEAVGGVVARMGPTVLRTSTAGTVAATVVLAGSRWIPDT